MNIECEHDWVVLDSFTMPLIVLCDRVCIKCELVDNGLSLYREMAKNDKKYRKAQAIWDKKINGDG